VNSPGDVSDLRRYRTAYHLLDSYLPGAYGGTGETFPWELARTGEAQRTTPMILAGGLNAGNVAEAIEKAQPFAVDTASGVEISPGIKDHAAMRDFTDAVRALDPYVPEPEPEYEEIEASREAEGETGLLDPLSETVGPEVDA